jgi:glycosyltransferase involved in cell wall biosynthesis
MSAARTPTVAVVVPYRNRRDSLATAIGSVLEQTHDNLELVLVDDASDDGSGDVARGFTDPRVRHVRLPERGGQCVARNAGIAATAERYVAFQDSDDRWFPTKLAVQLDALARASAAGHDRRIGIVGCCWRIVGGDGPRLSAPARSDGDDVLAGCVRGISTQTLLIDRDVVGDARFDPDLPALVDRDFVIGALGADHDVLVVDDVLVEVARGRSDHVATPAHALAAFEHLLEKYDERLALRPKTLAWYHFRAMREAIRCGDHDALRRHARAARPLGRAQVAVTAAAGRLAGRRGLAVAGRLGFGANPCCDGPHAITS